MLETFTFTPIGIVRSPYQDKFAVPRQPGLVPAGRGELLLSGDCNREEILRGIEGFSHLWLAFVFHRVAGQGWKPTVRPPRLGGNRRMGVFATRSPFRPNPIGLSVVTLNGIANRDGQWLLELSGIDLIDGTPILDIKPYVPYVDAIADARAGFAPEPPPAAVTVSFNTASRVQLESLGIRYPELETLIEQIIQQQPQPAYHRRDDNLAPSPDSGLRHYGMALYDLNIRWRVTGNCCEVIAIDSPPGDEQLAAHRQL